MISSIVSGNSAAKDGGGIANESLIPGTLAITTLTGSAVTDNSSAVNFLNSGGGIFTQAGSTVCLNGTVVAGNKPNNSTNVVFAPLCQ